MRSEKILSDIKDYWTDWADDFSEIIKKELNSFRREAWQDIILSNAPGKEILKVLDIGTGPGMFSILLAQRGHDLTAIDCTDDMIKQAQKNAAEHNVSVKYMKMDSHKLDFADDTFDLIVNRNVTWTLYDPAKAYKEWYRVLKPGGCALIFDANWGLFCFDDKVRQLQEKATQNYKKNYHEKDPVKYPLYNTTEKEIKYYKELFYSDKYRPDFDKEFLEKLGFSVEVNRDISRLIWDEAQCVKYKATPMFMIKATKSTKL